MINIKFFIQRKMHKVLTSIILSCILFFSFQSFAFADIKVQEFKTKKNIQVLFVEDKSSDLASVSFSFKGAGTRVDPQGKEGLANLFAQLLLHRTEEGNDHYLLNKKLRALGVLEGIHCNVDSDNITFNFKAPPQKLKEVFEVVKIMITDPVFDQRELDKMKNFDPSNSRLATAGEQEFAIKVLLNKLLAGHPYAFPASGTLDGRQAVTIDDIEDAFESRFATENLVFSVVGNIKKDNLSNYIDMSFGSLPKKPALPEIPVAKIFADGQLNIIPKDSEQSGIVFGHAAATISEPDYIPMQILNDILGGRAFTSRLWLEVRESRGLVYGIGTQMVRFDKASLLTGSLETDNSKVNEVIELVRQEWQKMHQNGITKEEFESSKTGLIGNFALLFTNNEGIGEYLLNCYLAGLPADYINKRNALLKAVTLEDVNRVAKNRLDPKSLTFVVVGQPEE